MKSKDNNGEKKCGQGRASSQGATLTERLASGTSGLCGTARWWLKTNSFPLKSSSGISVMILHGVICKKLATGNSFQGTSS